MTTVSSSNAALVLIDLMPRLVAVPLAPHTGDETLETCLALADRFRAAGAPVIAVRVDRPNVEQQPPGSDFAPGVVHDGDVVLVKRSIGAFATTDLHERLRSLGVTTLVMAGIATNLGVESTARGAVDRGYEVVFVEDAMTAFTADEHAAAVHQNFPRLGTVTTAADLQLD